VAVIKALFWDVGGVILTNAWDRKQRDLALQHFHLDPEEFQDRHELVVSSFERGKISLDEYLDRTVLYRSRSFSREQFKQYMYSLSQPQPGGLELAQDLAGSGRYHMATINNESRDLNDYRIERFGLRGLFRAFFSSCFVGLRKPERDIYRVALEVSQQIPDECCFIDDRALNLECAARLGMHTIEFTDAAQVRGQLSKLGVDLAGS
jgi:putative hydrolase of the HAD superfamily